MSLINDALKRASQTHKQRAPAPKLTAPLQPVESLRPPSRPGLWLVPVVLAGAFSVGGWLVWQWWQHRPAPPSGPGPMAAVQPAVPRPPALPPATTIKTSPAPPPPVATVNVTPAPSPPVTIVPPAPHPPPPAPPVKINTTLVTRPVPLPRSNPPTATIVKPVAVVPTVPTNAPPSLPPTNGMPLPAPQATNPLVAVVPPPQVPPANPGVVSNPAPITVPPPPPPLPKPEFPALKLQGVFYRSTNSSALINNRTVFVGDEIRNAKVIAIGRQSVTLEFAGEKHVITLY